MRQLAKQVVSDCLKINVYKPGDAWQLRQLAKQVVSDCLKVNGYIPGDVCVGGPASLDRAEKDDEEDSSVPAQLQEEEYGKTSPRIASEAVPAASSDSPLDEVARWVVPRGALVRNGGDCGPDAAAWLLKHQGPALYSDGPGVTREAVRKELQQTWKKVISDDPSSEEGRSFVAERLDQVPEARDNEDLEAQVSTVLHAILRQEKAFDKNNKKAIEQQCVRKSV